MVRADAGTGIGFEIRARAKRRVAVDGLDELHGSRNFAASLGVSIDDARHVHHFAEAEELGLLEERLRLPGIND